jgi:hypothetical protein
LSDAGCKNQRTENPRVSGSIPQSDQPVLRQLFPRFP